MSLFMDPTGRTRSQTVQLSQRLKTLDGCRLGLLDNTKPNARRLLEAVVDELKERYQLGEVVLRQKPVQGLPGPEPILDELAQSCDAVLVAVGD
ncbi:MAG: hypothetical protein K6U14_00375 [Firmicutes bacterium]|nr:hypothetical protein [Alicyclobacillaceae bacterium]MCL6496076.1 hypothetical protein [Bacillota bacterium]